MEEVEEEVVIQVDQEVDGQAVVEVVMEVVKVKDRSSTLESSQSHPAAATQVRMESLAALLVLHS